MFVLMSFLYFRLYFRCILAFLYLCAAVYGVIKNNNKTVINSARQLSRSLVGICHWREIKYERFVYCSLTCQIDRKYFIILENAVTIRL